MQTFPEDVEYGPAYLRPSFDAYAPLAASVDREDLIESLETFVTARDAKKIGGEKSFTFMAGGPTPNIPPDSEEEKKLWAFYANFFRIGVRSNYMTLTEKHTDTVQVFRLFVDLDFERPVRLWRHQIEAFAAYCISAVKQFFPQLASTCLVSWNRWSKGKDNEAHFKTGVHLHWPAYFVTSAQALDIRQLVLASMLDKFGPDWNWESIVDKSVYKSNGLKPLGAWKSAECKKCKRDPLCAQCKGKGYYFCTNLDGSLGRPYFLLCVLRLVDATRIERDLSGEAAYLSDFHKLLVDSKIRSDKDPRLAEQGQYGYLRPEGAPQHQEKTKRGPGAPKASITGRLVESADPAYRECQTIIRSAFGLLYKDIVVYKLKKVLQRYSVEVTGMNSRYCQNIGRQHNSNRIYFTITKEGVSQRCFDTGDLTDEMRHGPCSTYASSVIAIGPQSLSVLWPEVSDSASVMTHDMEEDASESFAIRALMQSIEYRMKRLWNSSWMSTVPQLMNKPAAPRTSMASVYSDLGLSWSVSMPSVDSVVSLDPAAEASKTSLAKLQKQVMDAFDSLVLLAANAAKPDQYADLKRLDDVCIDRLSDSEMEF